MSQVDPLQVGVVFWTGGELGVTASPAEIAQSVATLGLSCGQLGVHGEADLSDESAAAWKAAFEANNLTVVTAFMNYVGESYASIPTCAATVGYVPQDTRDEREQRALLVSDFAAKLGTPGLGAHIGALPEDSSHPDYVAVRELMRRICDRCAANNQTFALETGQESAEALKAFLLDVDRPNLGINFDPANMILYGCGDPIEALEAVKDHLLTVHCKDGKWPAEKGSWGSETPLGQGDVGMGRFINKLKEIGYDGPLVIEREIVGDEQRADILQAVELLESLK